MSEKAGIVLDRADGVAHIRFTRPEKANSLTGEFWQRFPDMLSTCADDPTIRVLVLSGEGKHFCSGIDIASFTFMQRDRGMVEGPRWRANFRKNLLAAQATLTQLETLRFPVIAAVQGACIGATVDLMCACDIRYAARDSYFTVHETNIALMADAGTLPRLAYLVPQGVARELVFSGRRMTAEEAERHSFVNALFDTKEAALVGAMEMAREIASKSPSIIWGAKEMFNYARDHTTADTLRYLATWQAGMISFEEIEAAVAAQLAHSQASFADVHLTASLFFDR